MSRYNALTTKLLTHTEPTVMLSFEELDRIVGGLPDSAKKHRAWWANKRTSQPHARAWLDAGRRATPDFVAGHAVFTIASPDTEDDLADQKRASTKREEQNAQVSDGEASTSDKLDQLKATGFVRAGRWTLAADGIALELDDFATTRNVLYAFIADGELMYVGKTVQQLRARMAGYRTPGPTQSTNIKNHGNIRELLAEGRSIEIYVLPDNGLLYYGGFHVNLAAGLEDSLVRELSPPWNGGQKETPAETLEPIIPD